MLGDSLSLNLLRLLVPKNSKKVMSNSIFSKFKFCLKQQGLFVDLKRALMGRLSGKRGHSRLDILSTFPIFSPISVGNYKLNSELTIQSINETIPLLLDLVVSVGGRQTPVESITMCPQTSEEKFAVERLKLLLDSYGSDKANHHNYHYFYGTALYRMGQVSELLEVGLGTNNLDVVSNMGRKGRPGASLRAFRDFLPGANLLGADIDRRILFSEDRIKTFHVDQTDALTFQLLGCNLPKKIDFIIDDGLHSPNANLQTLRFGLERLSVGGWIVIEDIRLNALPVWQLVAALLPEQYESMIFEASGMGMFAVQKKSVTTK